MFRPGKTRRMDERICVLRTLISNFYLVATGEGYIAFDAGMSPPLGRRALKSLSIDPASVTDVFLTHSDMDHRGGLAMFPSARVYLSAAETPLVTGQRARRFVMFNKRIEGYTPLADGETVTVGGVSVQLIAAPGHTPGSACYRIGEDAIATGDLLLVNGNGEIGQFSIVQNMDHAQNLATLQRLAAQGMLSGSRYLLTGHSGAWRTDSVSYTER